MMRVISAINHDDISPLNSSIIKCNIRCLNYRKYKEEEEEEESNYIYYLITNVNELDAISLNGL